VDRDRFLLVHWALRHRGVRPWPRPASSHVGNWIPTVGRVLGCRCPEWRPYPSMEISGGSLGHGLTVAVGMALGLRYRGNDARIYKPAF
jgi:hypothetical protein